MSIIAISNRLPDFRKAQAGGLVVAGESMLEASDIWLGSSGDRMTNGLGVSLIKEVFNKIVYASFAKSKQHFDRFYSGFANTNIWMMMHGVDYPPVNPADVAAYHRINKLYAFHAVAETTSATTAYWVHDYQLMAVPGYLRSLMQTRKVPTKPIGYFHHIPFPEETDFTKSDPRLDRKSRIALEDACRGLLEADLLGFQTKKDAENFRVFAARQKGVVIQNDMVIYNGRSIDVGVFPAAIDPKPFLDFDHRGEEPELLKKVGNRKLIFSVERRDPSKGIVEHLEGFELFLKNNPHMANKVVFFQGAAESRKDVEAYRLYSDKIQATVDRINNTYREKYGVEPVIYHPENIPREQLTWFFRKASLMVVTSLRDGMNLVAKEFVASQIAENPGVLMLGKDVGATTELGVGAIIVDPKNAEEIAAGMATAFNIPLKGANPNVAELDKLWDESLDRRRAAYDIMIRPIVSYTSRVWAHLFRERLGAPLKETPLVNLRNIRRYSLPVWKNAFNERLASVYPVADVVGFRDGSAPRSRSISPQAS